MNTRRTPRSRLVALCSSALAVALAWPAVAQDDVSSDDDGWIEADPDEPGSLEGGALGSEEDELPAEETEPLPAPEPSVPELPPVECAPVDLLQPPVEASGQQGERLLVLPLKDSAGKPEDTRILNDATVKELGGVLDVDYPPPEQVKRLEDGTLQAPLPPDPIPTERPRFEVVDGRCLEGAVTADIFEAIQDCERSTCMADIAEAVKADFIVYGQVATGQPPLVLYELKLFARDVDRVVSRATAEGPNGRILAPAVPAVLAQLIPVPAPPPPLPAPPIEPTVLESPLFIGGAAIALMGAVAAAASVAWLVDAELKLGTPEVHRDLKAVALTQWPYIAAVAAVSPVVIAAGLALMGASPFVLLLGQAEEGEADEGQTSTGESR